MKMIKKSLLKQRKLKISYAPKSESFLRKASGKTKDSQLIVIAALFFIFAAFIFISAFASAYSPPKYIANPETKECQYYFAGEEDCYNACMNECEGSGWNQSKCFEACADPCHYNKRPEGFTVDIGKTSDFKSQEDACNQLKDCINKNGEWNSETLTCKPKTEQSGQEKSASDTLAIAGITISVIALILIVLIYLKIRKMLKQIHLEKK